MNVLKYIIFPSILLMACSVEGEKTDSTETVTGSDNNTITISSEQSKTINVKIGKMEMRDISSEIKANGYLDVPPQNKALVSPMITGYVRKVNFLVGDDVKKGQVMAVLQSMEFIDLQQQYLELKSKLVYLKEDFERQKLLRDQDAVSKKKYLMAEVEYNTVVTSLSGLHSKLEMLGVNFNQLESGKISSNVLIKAPISGSVKTLNIVIGKHVEPAEEIYEIVNVDHIHLELSVYEKDINKVAKGQKVSFKIPSISDETYEGEVFLVGKDLSESKRSINVHVHIDEVDGPFKTGMYVNAYIAVNGYESYAVPVTSVVVDNNMQYMFRKLGDNNDGETYEKIPVSTGLEVDDYVELASYDGLKPDDEIVIDGAFYLLNAFAIGENN